MAYPRTMLEEELKNRVGLDYFSQFDTSRILGKIDFCVSRKGGDIKQEELLEGFNPTQNFVWAEAKKGTSHDIYESFVQLVLTIGKAKTYKDNLPPPFLAAFDAEKIAFIPYKSFEQVFHKNDFDWNTTPSNHEAKEFKELYEIAKDTMEKEMRLYKFGVPEDEALLKQFIKLNFLDTDKGGQAEITLNNFTYVYYLWSKKVMPTIAVNWDEMKKQGIIDADFYLADLLSVDDFSFKEKLQVVLEKTQYTYGRKLDITGGQVKISVYFEDNGRAHREFWKNFKRPPREEFWQDIIQRRDLLVPQDIRERKGSFYTPQEWVLLAQDYLAKEFGEFWQQEYYIWDCCAGTGNLLYSLTEKRRIWASTIDQSDVDVMKDCIANGTNLLEQHVFQFDFLNDDLSSNKIPEDLRVILQDPKKRKKLIIFMNPPYAEATTKKQQDGVQMHKAGVATGTSMYNRFLPFVGQAVCELYTQFLMRIKDEIPGASIGSFATLKLLQSTIFQKFRQWFDIALKSIFLVPSYTFDNVSGKFPIGFFIWNGAEKAPLNESYEADVYIAKDKRIGTKDVHVYDTKRLITEWLRQYYDKENEVVGYLRTCGTDIQHQQRVFVSNTITANDIKKATFTPITKNNLLETCIYATIRRVVPATWLNKSDRYVWPLDSWKTDNEFKTDSLIYNIFEGDIKTPNGEDNNWIPFSEDEVDAKGLFKSHFMKDYLLGKISASHKQGKMFVEEGGSPKLEFSKEARNVLDVTRELWRYYHKQKTAKLNASFYDIKAHFCGFTKGKLNLSSNDETYNKLNELYRKHKNILERKLASKVYKHGFLLH